MKKIYSLLAISIIALGLFFLWSIQSPKLYSNILIKEEGLVPSFQFLAHYSDLAQSEVTTYALTPSQVNKVKDTFLPYTEGFINKKAYKTYEKSILTLNPSFATRMPHDIYEDETLAILSFTGNLKAIYIIDKQTQKAHKLNYTASQDLGDMYVSHIRKVDDKLIILGGQVQANNAFIYTVDLATLTVEKSKSLPTHPSAINEDHYTLTAKGLCAFIDGYGLKVYDPFLNTATHIPLPFEAASITSSDSHLFVTSSGSLEGLQYASLDGALSLVKQGSLSLPSTSFGLVDIQLKDDYVYLTSFDPKGTLYLNYLSTYHLPSEKMVYSLGLGSLLPKVLLGIN